MNDDGKRFQFVTEALGPEEGLPIWSGQWFEDLSLLVRTRNPNVARAAVLPPLAVAAAAAVAVADPAAASAAAVAVGGAQRRGMDIVCCVDVSGSMGSLVTVQVCCSCVLFLLLIRPRCSGWWVDLLLAVYSLAGVPSLPKGCKRATA